MAWGEESGGTLDRDPSIPALVTRLIDDAKQVVRAEVGVAKAKAGERVEAYKGAAIFFGAAGVIALAALIALLVGLILALATLIGPGWATLVVVGVSLLLAGGLAMVGSRRLKGAPTP